MPASLNHFFPRNIYPIFDPRVVKQAGLDPQFVGEVWQYLGIRTFQFRFKTGKRQEFEQALAELPRNLRQGFEIIANDFARSLRLSGVLGLHLGQEDGHPLAVRRLLTRELGQARGNSFILGWSTHELKEIEEANRQAPGVLQYIGCGPVAASDSKTDLRAQLSSEELPRMFFRSRYPVVFIGGLDFAKIREIRRDILSWGRANGPLVNTWQGRVLVPTDGNPPFGGESLENFLDRHLFFAMIRGILPVGGKDWPGWDYFNCPPL